MEELLSPKETKRVAEISGKAKQTVVEGRKNITEILNGNDTRLLVMLGPPTIDDGDAIREYVSKLKELEYQVREKICIVLKTNIKDTYAQLKGDTLQNARKILVDINELEIPVATEFKNPFYHNYLEDCISYTNINEKDVESEVYIQHASDFDLPMGCNNTTDGNIQKALNTLTALKYEHTFLDITDEKEFHIKQSKGNYYTNLILVGSEKGPNYEEETIRSAIKKLRDQNLKERIIIHCGRHNANNLHQNQTKVALNILEQKKENPFIAGIILDSYLVSGKGSAFGQSKTIPCMDFQTTKALIERIYNLL